MAALYILIPVAVVLVALAIWVFFWAVDSGQFDDLDGPAHSILFDDEEPQRPSGAEPQETDEQQQEQRKGE
ncbi:cbb3-type cytochrome oxidase assembly protein CcoS [Stutzerimonas frequens]|uniref:cbb3-type cytochrome oxidase assembly protein CcoS n=1 Tax=Stutzerimonas frequens TaxID=2968969 RepID=UPI0012E24EA9|nr:cbb3-type cytochrome oxidase assembly protein CcoS [Stutzerimonas frequens]MUT72967.1 cbb3-type cytochrome oxidase assembly protein CcoS [Stutzerimonas frequens]